jgi:ABC-type branched-subunit amino acid transport system ATPase component
MIALSCRGLACEFGGLRALDGVDLELTDTDFVAISGDNGAGKTTLLNVLSGMVRLSGGRVALYGRDVTNHSVRRLTGAGVLRTLENGGTYERMSCEDNVAVGLQRGWLYARRRRARYWLGVVGLAERPGIEAGKLSMGQERRLELAALLAQVEDFGDRALVLLDEPGRGLDAEGRRVLVELLLKHLVGRVPVVMVEHDRSLVEQLGGRQVWMEAGRVAARPPRREDRPAKRVPLPVGEPLLRIRGVRAGHRNVEVLHGIDLEIRAGETVRLRGPNGAGKSTLLQVIMGTLPARSGGVELLGRVLAEATMRPYTGIGYAPQGGRLVPALTVRDHLELAQAVARRRGVPPDLGPAFLAAFPELEARMERTAADLSAGQRSLLAMACALTTEPQLLIADEPGAGMAPALADRLFDFLAERWSAPGRAALIVEHVRDGFAGRELSLERGIIA